jgi:F-type H+-transporting ATPase subunit b
MATPTTSSTGTPPPQVFPPFDTSKYGSQILWLAITFGLLYWLVLKVLVPRIGGILETRRDRIVTDLDEAHRLRDETEAARLGFEKALADARAKAGKLAQETRDELSAEVDGKKAKAEESLAAKLAEAEARIAAVKEKAMKEVGGIANETAEAIVIRLAGSAVGKSDVADAVAEALKR